MVTNSKDIYFGTANPKTGIVVFTKTPELAAALQKDGAHLKIIGEGVITYHEHTLQNRVNDLKASGKFPEIAKVLEHGLNELRGVKDVPVISIKPQPLPMTG